MSKLIYMKEILNTFSQERIKELIKEGELRHSETEEPYIVIVEDFIETENSISI